MGTTELYTPKDKIPTSLSDVVSRFTSRKFLLTISAFIALVVSGQYLAALAPIIAYLLCESYVDRGYANQSQLQTITVDSPDPDTADWEDTTIDDGEEEY